MGGSEMLSEQENQNTRDAGYTLHGEEDFQYTSRLRTPQDIHQEDTNPAKRKKKRPLLLALIILLILALCTGFFCLRYRIVLRRSENSFVFSVSRRSLGLRISPDTEPALTAPPFSGDLNESGSRDWTGGSLDMHPALNNADSDYARIFQACAPSIGALEAKDVSGGITHGSAIVLTEDGALLTATHLISGADQILVTLGGREYPAYVVGLDYATDTAVIKIDATGLQPAGFSCSDSILPGENIAVVGNPIGGTINLISTVIAGTEADYSFRGYSLSTFRIAYPLTDLASGSALVNSAGQVIGLVDQSLASQLTDDGGLGFAISMESIRDVINELLQNGFVAGRPSSGLSVSELPASYAAFYGYPSCIYISSVEENSTAYEAGLRRGDLILEVNGKEINSVNDLYCIINGLKAGDTLSVTVFRNGETGTTSFELMEAARPRS